MTKAERLEQLKQEEQLYKVLDKYFDAGWKEYVKGIRKQNVEANEELYKDILAIKGEEFVEDLKSLLKDIKLQHSLLTIATKPEGIELNDSRYTTIPKIWITQKLGSIYSENGLTGSMCIQLKEDRWIKINYQR